jgi:hypothetical protein
MVSPEPEVFSQKLVLLLLGAAVAFAAAAAILTSVPG